MAKEVIPWRSLISPTETKAIQEKYYFEGVPTTILVNPNGNFEFLDLDNKEHLSALYSIHYGRDTKFTNAILFFGDFNSTGNGRYYIRWKAAKTSRDKSYIFHRLLAQFTHQGYGYLWELCCL